MKKIYTFFVVLFICSMQTALATNVSGTISTNTTWNLAGSPYVVTSSITVNTGVILTVESGVTVQFNNGQGMIVNGTLNATGTIFTSSSGTPTPGIWGVIQTGNASYSGVVHLTSCQVLYAQYLYVYKGTATLDYTDLSNFSSHGVLISSAGTLNMSNGNINTPTIVSSTAGINCEANSHATLTNVNIQHFTYGICLYSNASFSFNSSTITNCTWPIYYVASADLTLSGTNNFTGNTNSVVNLAFASIPDTLVLPSIALPYYSGTVTVNHGASLSIPSGSSYKFTNSAYLYVYGHLTATNTIFTSINSSPNPGDWGNITVGTGIADSGSVHLSSCQINYGSRGLNVANGIATLTSTNISNTLYSGVEIGTLGIFNMTNGNIITSSSTALASYWGVSTSNSSHAAISGVTIQGYRAGIFLSVNARVDLTNMTITGCTWPIYYAGSADLTLNGTNNFSGNTNSVINLAFGSIADTLILPSTVLPYYSGTVTVNHGASMNIPSGSTYKFANGAYLTVYGHLTATNTVFTSVNSSPNPGDWSQITVGAGIADSGYINLASCQINYGTRGLYIVNGKAILSNTNISNTLWHGVEIQPLGTLQMTNGNIITNNATAHASYNGICANSNSHATISGVTIQGYSGGVYLNSNAKVDLTDMTITGCIWPVYYANSADLTVHSTISLTGNTWQAIYMNFTSFSDTLILPELSLPYSFTGSFTINAGARLVIADNSILKFPDGTYLSVNGTLIADASTGHSIYFTSIRDDNWGGDSNNNGSATAPSTSNWYGIKFFNSSDDVNCIMRRCKVRYAGAGYTGGISMENASPAIDHCDLSSNYHGIYMQYASNPVLSYNTIGSSSMTPIAMSFEADPVMIDNVLSFSDNTYDAIGLIGGTLTANAVVKKRNVTTVQNITYLLLSQVTIPSSLSLTINKGIVIKFQAPSPYEYFLVNGSLNANATADSMITFTSVRDDNYGNPGDCNRDGTMTSPAIGNWSGIIFNPGSTGTLNYCRIRYAGSYYNWYFSSCSTNEYLTGAGVETIDASPVISNCEFKDLNYGISCHRASSPIISNNSFINITNTPVCISSSSDPVFTGNTFTNVKMNAIGILGGYVCQNGTIKKRNVAGYTNITYILLNDMTINSGTYVNVEADVVLKYNGSTNIYIDGGFKTDGTSGHNVVFTSIQDDNEGNPLDANGDGNATTPAWGQWGCIKFRATSDDAYCNIRYTTIKYAGYGDKGGICFENAGGQVNNSTITNTYNYGIYSNGNSTPSITSVNILNCRLDPLAMSLLSDPVFTNITFSANGSQAIKIIEGTLSSAATIAPRNIAGITNIAYIIDNLSITTNGSLTVQPGVIFKFRNDDSYYNYGAGIKVYGKFIAKGLSGNKIYFTSYADDSKGGDSNNNGNASVPGVGDWCNDSYSGISFYDVANDTMKYCEISYPNSGLYFSNAHAVIDNCVCQLIPYYGVHIMGSSNPEINNCQFNTIAHSPIRLSMFSNPSFSNNTCLNIGRMALTVAAETYSQCATIPIRNFGGYNNITYYMESACTINSGTTITVPAGIVFKSSRAYGFNVNGRLNIQGTSGIPVVFTNEADDTYGNPMDMNQDGSATQPPNGNSNQLWYGNWLSFSDVSNDSSTVQYTTLKYGDVGILLTSAAPAIDHVRFENLYYGVDLNGVSTPKIDNCIFHNLRYYPMQISLVSFPSSITNNLISGTSYKVIKVRNETLTQDVTLTKQSFGGINNIPYLFGSYTVGTGATLTINPGVVCKFNGGALYVYKGLIAEGETDPDSNIVFTDFRDDFFGGDSNSDSTYSVPALGSWQGIYFYDQALDPLCRLRNCFIKYSNHGINTISASPQVTYSTITKNYYGVYATAASNPVFNYCDFDDNYYWAVDNVDKSFVIDATNCWWGSNLGPIQTNTAGNGTSPQELITTSVNYLPFRTSGVGNPMMGDVSLNGLVQSYDAALVLQHVVSLITLNSVQQQVADVSGVAGITAYDASLISQYVVGLIQSFLAELTKSENLIPVNAQLTVGNTNAISGQNVTIPINISNVSGLYSVEINLHYDPLYLHVSQVVNMIPGMNLSYGIDSINGILTIAMAGAYPLNVDAVLVNVTFQAILPSGNSVVTSLSINEFLANEADMTGSASNGSVTITDNMTTGIVDNEENMQGQMLPVYPNPATDNAIITYVVNGNNRRVTIEIFDILGQRMQILVDMLQDAGIYSIPLSEHINLPGNGFYLIRMTVDGAYQTQRFQILR